MTAFNWVLIALVSLSLLTTLPLLIVNGVVLFRDSTWKGKVVVIGAFCGVAAALMVIGQGIQGMLL